MADRLKKIRDRIDALDDRILKLFNSRARLAQRVARLKNGAVYRPEREAQVLRRLQYRNAGPLSGHAVARLFSEIMSACRALQDALAVAYLGPRGTFSEEAVLKHFGGLTAAVPCSSIDEVFREVETGAVGYGVVPVENSTEGAVGRTLDLLLATPLKICGEVMLPVHQCLMNKSGGRAEVRRIYSHTQSLAQCHEWLNQHHPKAERVAVVSNAEAARLAGLDRRAAAVAGRTAAERYGLAIIARNIEDDPKNTTRFLVLATHDAAPSGADKTSRIMSARTVPGAMHDLLTPLAKYQVSMTRLESRPSRTGLWEYVFYVDVEGHQRDANLAKALAELERRASFLKDLGSYPAAVM
ncbi:MAG: prephenate dehydratase [Betaproteobacteria bacterium]|nr:prephenate dehydratase [Betaproteobacteria bacterium]